MPSRSSGSPFTVAFPRELPVERSGDAWALEANGHALKVTNLDKVYWPEEGYTKGDLLAYYWNVAPLMLPHLVGRPLTMKRMPNGIAGEFFYEKSAPSHTPGWIPRCRVASEDATGGGIDYLSVADEAEMIFVANLGCIEFHPLHSRCDSIDRPDYLFFDLDPFEPFEFSDILAVTRHVGVALERLGLRGYPKTSGATGMQIFVPIEPRYSYTQVRELVGKVGRLILRADPDRVTMEPRIADRAGRIYIDHNMNREGANIASVYSLRPEPGATVSTPLTWDEIERAVVPGDFRIDNVFERLERVGDLFSEVRSRPQDLDAALDALGVEAPGPARTSDEVIASSRDPDLADYLRKRDFGGTSEPPPSRGANTTTGDSFVIHKHDATRLHYDLRLESDGALPSWAIPRGLPLAHGDKRLAVRTEDHPLEYGSFEGVIPKGHYGAGRVWIFDSGTYERLEWDDRKVSFVLNGRRYRGLEWHLVKTQNDWLVFLASKQAAPRIEPPPSLQPMLAQGNFEAFDDPAWRFEPKFDGIRALVTLTTDSTKLVSRNGRDLSTQYPELSTLHHDVLQANAILDGEVVAADESGHDSFELMQQRMNLSSPAEIKRVSKQIPVAFVAFDVLFLDGDDTTGLPLEDRRLILEHLVDETERIRLSPYVDASGIAFTRQAEKLGLEGIMAKRLGSRYRPGRRSDDWRKIKLRNTQDCVILGWTPGQGSRGKTFGALLVGAYRDEKLIWIGQVGTGFNETTLEALLIKLEPLARAEPASDDPGLASVKRARFVEPDLVCEVEYQQITGAGKMRAPSYRGLREDKSPEDCTL